MPRKNVNCDECRKEIRGEEIAYFSDAEKDLDFCSEESKEFLEFGLTSSDYFYYRWLKNSKQLTPQQVLGNEQQLREEYNKTHRGWLEKYYPNKEEYIPSIYLNQQLEGVLDCRKYKGLKKIFISTQVERSKLKIIKGSCKYGNETFETKIIPCISAQYYLNQNYPKDGTCVRKNEIYKLDNFGKKREQITKLNISGEGSEGDLDLSDFTDLEELDCHDNYLTNLNLNNFIKNNNLNTSDLTIFSPMRNLKRLEIGNHNKNKIRAGIYNRIEGSCKPLKDLNRLERLNINNTDTNSGWEYLPDSLKYFYYDT
ncbi:7916_t:CDS:2 [Diversispora eburnea]|uniref:7916_t:CDS:1 n=1 Tax=Diversispora eburnea TaxID=1213867 RepID=A0A9N9GR73_9GLOM|nr:7916_t:CDS:2 [Diversispora eburnea]